MESPARQDWRAFVKAFVITAACLGFILTTRRVQMNYRVLWIHVDFDNDNARKGIYPYVTLYGSLSARRQPRESPGLSRAKVRAEIKAVQKIINIKPAGRKIIDITHAATTRLPYQLSTSPPHITPELEKPPSG